MKRIRIKKITCFIIGLIILFSLIGYNFKTVKTNTKKFTPFYDIKTSDNIPDIDLSFLPEIDYTTLNDSWYNPKIEMLIITPNRTDFIDAVKPLMDWKNEIGVKTIILSNFSLYEGVDDAERIRNMIKSYYEKENIRWVLLTGDAQNDLIPIRKVYNPDVLIWGDGRTETVGGEEYKPTDYYYADLDGIWDSDKDGNWGETPQDNWDGLDEISWTPEVYVGRLPADNVNELEIMVNKTLKYESDPELGDWMNRMLLAGGISDYPSGEDPDGEYESWLTSYIINNYVKNEVNYTHLVEEEGTLNRYILNKSFGIGYSTVLMAGHGAPTVYYRNPSTAAYYSDDAKKSNNTHRPSLVYLDACSTSSYDYNDNNIGESLMKRELGGAIGVIGGLRVTWYFTDDVNLEMVNRGNAKLFWKEFFVNKKFQQGKALYDSKVSYINSDYYKIGNDILKGSTDFDFERKNILTYCLLGDPSLDIYTNKPKLALNPFTESIYEGQLVSITIRDIDGIIVPYARVNLRGPDGKYQTVYADESGLAGFRLPALPNELYNVTITGHNLKQSNFNFTTLPDSNKPQLLGVECNPKNPKTSDIIAFNIEAHDNNSGIESVYILLSKNNFTNYKYYGLSNSIEENKDLFPISTERLTPGDYSCFIVIRDYANNINTFYNSDFNFSVPKPMMDYILISSSVMIVAIIGISVFSLFHGLQKYSRIVKEIERLT